LSLQKLPTSFGVPASGEAHREALGAFHDARPSSSAAGPSGTATTQARGRISSSAGPEGGGFGRCRKEAWETAHRRGFGPGGFAQAGRKSSRSANPSGTAASAAVNRKASQKAPTATEHSTSCSSELGDEELHEPRSWTAWRHVGDWFPVNGERTERNPRNGSGPRGRRPRGGESRRGGEKPRGRNVPGEANPG